MPLRIGFGRRFVALLVDAVLVLIVTVVLAPVIGGLLGVAVGVGAGAAGADPVAIAAGGALGAIVAFLIAVPFVSVAYFVVEGVAGWTPGKLALGLQIASADGTAAPVEALLGRFAVKHAQTILASVGGIAGVELLETIGGLAGLVVFIGCFLALGEARQALHDKAAGTAVFARSDLQGDPSRP